MFRRTSIYTSFIALLFFFVPQRASAIPPPDLIFQLAGQMGTMASIVAVFFSVIFLFIRNAWTYYMIRVSRRMHWIIGIILCIVSIGALLYSLGIFTEKPLQTQEELLREIIWEEHRLMPYTDGNPKIIKSEFYEAHKDLPLTISNTEFTEVLRSGQNAYFLDPREPEEQEIGYFPGSVHIRYADLRIGQWSKLPTDKVVYVFCYGGARGEVIADFLRSRGILARSLEDGAFNWKRNGGAWVGDIDFYAVHHTSNFLSPMIQETRKSYEKNGAFLIDTRILQKYNASHIPGSMNIPIVYMPTKELDAALAAVPEGKDIITVCDDLSSCFDARVVGLRLERKGHQFLGVYDATPKEKKSAWQKIKESLFPPEL